VASIDTWVPGGSRNWLQRAKLLVLLAPYQLGSFTVATV
jgi:hypothetical protein